MNGIVSGKEIIYEGLAYECDGDECAFGRNSSFEFSGAFEIPGQITDGDRWYTVTSIADHALGPNTNLTSIKIPASVESIGMEAFWQCDSLESVNISGSSPISLGSGLFGPSNKKVRVHCTPGMAEYLRSDGIFPKLDLADRSQIDSSETPTAVKEVPLPEDEIGAYAIDPVTGEKIYLLFHTYEICMNWLGDDVRCRDSHYVYRW